MKLSERLDRVFPVQGLQEFDTFIEQILGPRGERICKFVPRTNIVEQEKGFRLTLELPGVSASDVSVEVVDDRLVVSGDKTFVDVDETSTVHRRERITGKFERSFEFPTQVDFEKIEASSRDGVLTIVVPKSEKVLPRKIEIAVK